MKLLEKLKSERAEHSERMERVENNERREFYRQRCEELTEQLSDIRSNFDFATEPQVIESLIYAEKSVTCMLEQLFRSAREEGITLELHERQKK